MTLIQHPECDHNISASAPAGPDKRANSATGTITAQRTSKKLKAQLFISAFVFWFGLLSWFLPYGGTHGSTSGVSWSASVILVGGIWYSLTRLMIWWEHG
jgi:hypothetical protein